MMSIDVKVNGVLIGHAYIANEGYEEGKGDLRKYFVKYNRKGKDEKTVETYVMHKRNDGAEKLAEIVFSKIYEELKKNK